MSNDPRLKLTGPFTARVDPDVYEKLRVYKFYADSNGLGYRWNEDKTKRIFLHREVTGAGPGEWVFFLNEDPTDCRRENLGVCPRGAKRTYRRRAVLEKMKSEHPASGEGASIRLTDGSEVWVDADVYDSLKDRIWHRYNGCAMTVLPDGKHHFLHREVMGSPRGLYITFKDGDKLNCRRNNLVTFHPGTKHAVLAELREEENA